MWIYSAFLKVTNWSTFWEEGNKFVLPNGQNVSSKGALMTDDEINVTFCLNRTTILGFSTSEKPGISCGL